MSIDEWAAALTVFVVVTGLFLFIGPMVYRWENGAEKFLDKPGTYFDITAFVTSIPPGGAVMLSFAFLPIPSVMGYVAMAILVALGCVAGSIMFQEMIRLLVVMNTPAPEDEQMARIRVLNAKLAQTESKEKKTGTKKPGTEK